MTSLCPVAAGALALLAIGALVAIVWLMIVGIFWMWRQPVFAAWASLDRAKCYEARTILAATQAHGMENVRIQPTISTQRK